MDRNEAIEHLKVVLKTCDVQDEEAVEMAIDALEQAKTNCSEFPNNSDTISRTQAIYAMESEIVSTNPEHFKSSEKFIKFMDDADIASFGKWQWANGFNTGVVATRIQLKKLPSAQPEIIRCKDCVNHIDNRCTVADHHVAPFSCCQSVFNAKNRGEQK